MEIKRRNVISRNHHEYKVVMSNEFRKELQEAGVSEDMIIDNNVGTVSSTIEFKVGDRIRIGVDSFFYKAEDAEIMENIIENDDKLEKTYRMFDNQIVCEIVDIYFDLSIYNPDYYDEKDGKITPFTNEYPYSSWIVVIQPVEKYKLIKQ